MTWVDFSSPEIEQRCLSVFAWHQHQPLENKNTHTYSFGIYFGSWIYKHLKMQQTHPPLLGFSCHFISVLTLYLCLCVGVSFAVPRLRCFVRWWPWSRLDMWCWQITCRTTSGSSSSSSWVRCLPRTPEWRMCSHPVRHHPPKHNVHCLFHQISIFTHILNVSLNHFSQGNMLYTKDRNLLFTII